GGEQESFIRLGGKPADLDQATKIVQALGGRLLHAFPPKFLVVMLPKPRSHDSNQAGRSVACIPAASTLPGPTTTWRSPELPGTITSIRSDAFASWPTRIA